VRLTLCLLTWNEIEGCRHDLHHLPLAEFDQVFAVDGGSTDGTCEYLRSCGIVVYPQNIPTYNGAYIRAFGLCTTDAVVLYQPKGTIDPAAVLKFRPLFEAGADLVIASRIGSGARNEEDDKVIKHRKWFVIGLALVSSLVWRRQGPIVWDVLHGVRGMRRAAFESIVPLSRGVSIDLEMVVRAYKRRMRIASFPVEERRRIGGVTHFKAWPTGKQLLKYLWSELSRI
jgi:hypothetical protein